MQKVRKVWNSSKFHWNGVDITMVSWKSRFLLNFHENFMKFTKITRIQNINILKFLEFYDFFQIPWNFHKNQKKSWFSRNHCNIHSIFMKFWWISHFSHFLQFFALFAYFPTFCTLKHFLHIFAIFALFTSFCILSTLSTTCRKTLFNQWFIRLNLGKIQEKAPGVENLAEFMKFSKNSGI